MLIFYFGILQFGKCWELISQPVELVELKKHNGVCGEYNWEYPQKRR